MAIVALAPIGNQSGAVSMASKPSLNVIDVAFSPQDASVFLMPRSIPSKGPR